MTGRPRSLKSRALQLLAQREQSRVELRRKLMTHATAEDVARLGAESESEAESEAAGEASAQDGNQALPGGPSDDATARVDAVLAWLEANRFVSDQRFAESRVHARASRYGNLRIRQELKQHGVALSDETAQQLQATEWARAVAVWQRRFGEAPHTAADSARQARFLTARGFSPDIVRRVLRARPAGAGAGPGDALPGDD